MVLVGTAVPVGSQQPAERRTITLFDPAKTNYERFLNEGKQGLSPGDTVLFVENQLDTETCERAGQLVGNIMITKILKGENALFEGSFTLLLPDGKITAGGVARFSEFMNTEPIFAVTGGTGAYRDASGEVTIQEGVELCGKAGDLTTIDLGPQP